MKWLKQLWQKNPKAVVVGVCLQAIVIIAAGAFWLTMSKPHLVSTTITSNSHLSLLSPLRFNFSAPISRRSFQSTIEPTVAGNWDWGDSVVSHLQSQVSFTPDEAWQPNQTYTVFLIAQNILENKTEKFSSTFTTESVPSVARTSVTGAVDVSPISPITVTLSAVNDGSTDYSFIFDPAVVTQVVLSDDRLRYTLTPQAALQPGTAYTLTVDRQLKLRRSDNQLETVFGNQENIFTTTFTTLPPAGIQSFSPSGSRVLPTVRIIDITFNEPMERSSVETNTSFSPTLSGSWQWIDDTRAKYLITKALDFDTTYRVTFAALTPAKSGVTFAKDTVETFKTVGNLKVTKISPSNKSAGILRGSAISLTFDQAADQASVEASFNLSPKVTGALSWRGQVVTFTPSVPLDFSTTYTVGLTVSAKSALDKHLSTTFSSTFTTEERTVLLDIATYRQKHALSCEAASLKMALGYKGVTVSEDDIMAIVGYDPTIRAGNIWGDPNQAFVGDINGSQNTSGYGVYWGPIASAAKVWRQAEAFSGWSVVQVAKQIDAGSPVLVWGTLGSASPDSWLTPAGQTINAWKGEHTRLVVGYRGNPDNPTSIILNDPIAGRLLWSVAKFKGNWSSFGNSGVVVK